MEIKWNKGALEKVLNEAVDNWRPGAQVAADELFEQFQGQPLDVVRAEVDATFSESLDEGGRSQIAEHISAGTRPVLLSPGSPELAEDD